MICHLSIASYLEKKKIDQEKKVLTNLSKYNTVNLKIFFENYKNSRIHFAYVQIRISWFLPSEMCQTFKNKCLNYNRVCT